MPELTPLETEVLHRCIADAQRPEWRPRLENQLRHSAIVTRTEKTFGYYIDFEVPDELRIAEMTDDANKSPMSAGALHPDGKNGICFILYIKDGKLNFLELSSTSEWPKDEDAIRFLDPPSPSRIQPS
ncbi:MAG TPA: hypothetical protein VLF18_12950 [Tahibacter sp.]|uniref:hypothetical protein n=1 Tax=Tahibacter sp. TaxID=2056211 RepID=UPI002BDCE0DA|nr:hypothetical protein [Tahibacter sp.]HSX61105.1 hypothetical protein [Tahibacter sp.]